jgi:hypothetical protein
VAHQSTRTQRWARLLAGTSRRQRARNTHPAGASTPRQPLSTLLPRCDGLQLLHVGAVLVATRSGLVANQSFPPEKADSTVPKSAGDARRPRLVKLNSGNGRQQVDSIRRTPELYDPFGRNQIVRRNIERTKAERFQNLQDALSVVTGGSLCRQSVADGRERHGIATHHEILNPVKFSKSTNSLKWLCSFAKIPTLLDGIEKDVHAL